MLPWMWVYIILFNSKAISDKGEDRVAKAIPKKAEQQAFKSPADVGLMKQGMRREVIVYYMGSCTSVYYM